MSKVNHFLGYFVLNDDGFSWIFVGKLVDFCTDTRFSVKISLPVFELLLALNALVVYVG